MRDESNLPFQGLCIGMRQPCAQEVNPFCLQGRLELLLEGLDRPVRFSQSCLQLQVPQGGMPGVLGRICLECTAGGS